jgi:hypothetical protein
MSKVRRFFYDTEFMEEPGFLDLISIGVVGEDGREFYACNSNAKLNRANTWVKENVINQLPPMENRGIGGWMTHYEIRHTLLGFLMPSEADPVELWGYYADYDHVLLCWLFGPMIDLPKGMPMYTMDIKQLAVSLDNPPLPKKPDDLHNALADAKWNRQAYQFLTSLSG